MKTLGLALLVFSLGCGRGSQESTAATGSSSVASAGPSTAQIASGAPSTGAPPSASGSATPAGARSWKGAYKTTVGTLTVPADLSKTHWSSSDATTGVGEGTLMLLVDPQSHRVTGTLDGVAGPAVIEGQTVDTQVSASVRRKDPLDWGFVGTLLASAAADHIIGTLTLASGDGAVLRTGSFSLTPQAP